MKQYLDPMYRDVKPSGYKLAHNPTALLFLEISKKLNCGANLTGRRKNG